MKDSVDVLEKGVKSDLDIDDFAIDSMIKSFKNFQDVADIKYTKLDEALANLNGMVKGSGTNQMRDSRWHKQVPNRAERLCKRMEEVSL